MDICKSNVKLIKYTQIKQGNAKDSKVYMRKGQTSTQVTINCEEQLHKFSKSARVIVHGCDRVPQSFQQRIDSNYLFVETTFRGGTHGGNVLDEKLGRLGFSRSRLPADQDALCLPIGPEV